MSYLFKSFSGRYFRKISKNSSQFMGNMSMVDRQITDTLLNNHRKSIPNHDHEILSNNTAFYTSDISIPTRETSEPCSSNREMCKGKVNINGECMWLHTKKDLPKYGTVKNHLESYLGQHLWRVRHQGEDLFLTFFKAVKKVYNVKTWDSPTE